MFLLHHIPRSAHGHRGTQHGRGQEIQIPAGRVVRFSASANFKEAVK